MLTLGVLPLSAPALLAGHHGHHHNSSESGGKDGHFPQLMIIGAQKAATTSVFELLKDAKLVCGQGGLQPHDLHEKEAHYFDRSQKDWEAARTKNPREYFEFYGQKGCDTWADATPNYLFDNAAPARMVEIMPSGWQTSVKMLAILREPLARDLSIYNMMKEEWWKEGKGSSQTKLGSIDFVMCEYSPGNFPTYKQACACKVEEWQQTCMKEGKGDAVEAYHACAYDSSVRKKSNRFTNGMYYPQIKNYVSRFSRHQVMVLNFDDLISNQKDGINRIMGHFGLSSHKKLTRLPSDNQLSFPGKVSHADCKTVEKVWKVYEPLNRHLYTFLKEDPSGKKPSHEPDFSEFEKPSCMDEEDLQGELLDTSNDRFEHMETQEDGAHLADAHSLSSANSLLPKAA